MESATSESDESMELMKKLSIFLDLFLRGEILIYLAAIQTRRNHGG